MGGVCRWINLFVVAILLVVISGFSLVVPVAAATFNAGTAAELITAIESANANDAADVINLTAADYTYFTPYNLSYSALPPIASEITINGNGATIARSTGDGIVEFRILQVSSNGNLTLNSVTITNGSLSSGEALGSSETLSNSLTSWSFGRTAGSGPDNAGAGIYNSGSLIVNHCTIESNNTDEIGGGIFNLGTMEINNSMIRENSAPFGGGICNLDSVANMTCSDSEISGNLALAGCGIFNDAIAVFNNCVVNENHPPADVGEEACGGGILNMVNPNDSLPGRLELNDCTLENNGSFWGGGLSNGFLMGDGDYPGGTVTIKRSTLGNNQAYFGGGCFNYGGDVKVVNCTISSNTSLNMGDVTQSLVEGFPSSRFFARSESGSSSFGGGCLNAFGRLEVVCSTITGNQSEKGGGILTIMDEDLDLGVFLKNTIISGNLADTGVDCSGLFVSYGFNLVGTLPGDPAEFTFTEVENPGTDKFDSDPLLGPLQDNGGKTFTHALLPGSPAINSGNCTDIEGAQLMEDQRGEIRPYLNGGACDVGAYEYPSSDGTDVPSEVQDDGPNNGDGNGDGILDSRQRTVASLPAGDGDGYITVEISGCDHVQKVKTYSYDSFAGVDPEYEYPYGLVGFEISCSSATVRIYYHGVEDIESYTYRKYGPTPDDWEVPLWYDMTGVIFGSKEIDGKMVPYVEFFLSEGQLGDDTNGSPIVDAGGLGQHTASIPTLNEWGMIVMSLLLAGISLVAISRKRDRMEL